jgi:hypothetical protein
LKLTDEASQPGNPRHDQRTQSQEGEPGDQGAHAREPTTDPQQIEALVAFRSEGLVLVHEGLVDRQFHTPDRGGGSVVRTDSDRLDFGKLAQCGHKLFSGLEAGDCGHHRLLASLQHLIGAGKTACFNPNLADFLHRGERHAQQIGDRQECYELA